MNQLTEIGRVKEWQVTIPSADGRIKGRICALRKGEQATRRTLHTIKRRAQKGGPTRKPETLQYARYMLVFTTLDIEELPGAEVLEWYRLRWQVELVFKRLKSLARIGHLPKYDEQSSRAWLYGKLLVALLSEKLIRVGRSISPGGTSSRKRKLRSHWRDFSFALHTVLQGIDCSIPVSSVIENWNSISAKLAERLRKRIKKVNCFS
ncbi:MAG: transposase [Bryobacteraceae bacterium]